MLSKQVQIQQRLSKFCNRKINKLGLGLTASCRNRMERMIHNGVERMKTQGAIEREEQIYFAEQNLTRYVVGLSGKAQSLGTFPIVDDRAFDKVLKEQCPIWPYC